MRLGNLTCLRLVFAWDTLRYIRIIKFVCLALFSRNLDLISRKS